MKLFRRKKLSSQELSRAQWKVKKINQLWFSDSIQKLTDEQLKAKTQEFKERYKKGETLNSMAIEVFAVAKEAVKRVMGKTLFDVQLCGSFILHWGHVAEMRTGEGKTITSIPCVYLNTISGESTIVSTVNEYLTVRDAEDNGRVYNFLGLTVGTNKRELNADQKREAYACDVTYSVHSEIGFDYLRDNMVKRMEDKVQRPFSFCLIDEADSILIDEAKTPLIISGGKGDQSRLYQVVDAFVKGIAKTQKEDVVIDLETKGISLSDAGAHKAEKFFAIKNLYAVEHSELVHRIQNAMRANIIMSLDVEYIVREGKLILVDSFTGRVMPGRSYSDGLQQAIQAKEGIEIEPETKTLATITYQNLFRLFKKLAGMTGTAKTEEQEFIDIYNMRVIVVPTNRPLIRKDLLDRIYVAKKHKIDAIIKEIEDRHNSGWPILIGTAAVEDSEEIANLLKEKGVKFQVLNAKNDELEAEIVAKAGQVNAITISTNMAGRGTDIKVAKEILDAGRGLFVLGTDKAEARRIDNQLRGRSGRQGEYGESQFIISLDDQLISRFSSKEKLKRLFESYGDQPIISRSMNKALLRAQTKIENLNFDSRKQVLDYDDVLRQQREVMYRQRDIIIGQKDLYDVIKRLLSSVVNDIPKLKPLQNNDGTINYELVANSLNTVWFSKSEEILYSNKISKMHMNDLLALINEKIIFEYVRIREGIKEKMGEEFLHNYEREVILNTFDQNWQNHIDIMDKLRSSVSLSAYAQKNPIQIYIQKGHDTFQELVRKISHNVARLLMADRFAVLPSTTLPINVLAKAPIQMPQPVLIQEAQVQESQPQVQEQPTNLIQTSEQPQQSQTKPKEAKVINTKLTETKVIDVATVKKITKPKQKTITQKVKQVSKKKTPSTKVRTTKKAK